MKIIFFAENMCMLYSFCLRLFATLLWFIGEVVDMFPVYERNFALDDPLISFPHTKQQCVALFSTNDRERYT